MKDKDTTNDNDSAELSNNKDDERKPRSVGMRGWFQSHLRKLAQFLALLLQKLISGLEHTIELLGCEPDRRWENSSIFNAVGAGKGSVDSICKRAKTLADKGYTEDALNLYIKVLEMEPDNTSAMDWAAELLAELGDAEGAKELIVRSIELQPSQGYEKFVLLGHLEANMDAIYAFERGLELLKAEFDKLEGSQQDASKSGKEAAARVPELKRKMSAVLVAIAKVYLTDCFEDPSSKETCESLLDRALEYDAQNPEACQALGDLRLSQGRRGEAMMLVRRSMEICQDLPDGLVPTYDFRMVTARLLVELSQYDVAATALDDLCCEDEEDTEAWYLLGMCHLLLSQPAECKKALNKAKKLLLDGAGNCGVDTLLEQIGKLLERRTISESEKELFWNPRWWVAAAGKAVQQPAKAMDRSASETGDLISSDATINLDNPMARSKSTPRISLAV